MESGECGSEGERHQHGMNQPSSQGSPSAIEKQEGTLTGAREDIYDLDEETGNATLIRAPSAERCRPEIAAAGEFDEEKRET